METQLIKLSPQFIAALKKVAPKRRRSKLPYIVGVMAALVVIVLGRDPSTREFAITKGREIAVRWHMQPTPPAAQAGVSAPRPTMTMEVGVPVLMHVAPLEIDELDRPAAPIAASGKRVSPGAPKRSRPHGS
jgi:hypothetical protein